MRLVYQNDTLLRELCDEDVPFELLVISHIMFDSRSDLL